MEDCAQYKHCNRPASTLLNPCNNFIETLNEIRAFISHRSCLNRFICRSIGYIMPLERASFPYSDLEAPLYCRSCFEKHERWRLWRVTSLYDPELLNPPALLLNKGFHCGDISNRSLHLCLCCGLASKSILIYALM